MTVHHHTYGTSAHTPDELVRLVSDRLGLAFTERDSYFLGVYHLAKSPGRKIEIQPNSIPGDNEDEDDLYDPEHPAFQVLLLTTTPGADPGLRAALASVEGLVHLALESET